MDNNNDISAQQHTCTISKLVYQGWGLGYIEKLAVFIPGTIPQDKVQIQLIKKHRKHAKARILNFTQKSPLRTQSFCQFSSECGGCQMIEVAYQDQIKLKESILIDAIQQFLPEIRNKSLPILPAKENIYYRNKMDFSFSSSQNNQIYSGLKARGEFDRIIPLKTCFLQSKLSNEIRNYITNFFTDNKVTCWNYHHHTGFLRYLVIRHSKTFDKYLINIIVSENKRELIQILSKKLTAKFPQVSSVFFGINPQKSDTSFAPDPELVSGPSHLKEKIGNTTFIISPQSFFQTNTTQTIILYQKIAGIAKLKKSDILLDLYCGTGTIGLFLADQVKEVIGIEENPAAIKDAENNARLNNIKNTKFLLGRVKNILKFNHFKPDCIIIDPPRCGMVPKALKRMVELNCPKLIYVSCNPSTLLRDLKEICKSGYKIEIFQPVDMFPNTFHIEIIVSLKQEVSVAK